jgi:hypothetical protein
MAGGHNVLDLLLEPGNRKVEIDKAGAGDFDGADRWSAMHWAIERGLLATPALRKVAAATRARLVL